MDLTKILSIFILIIVGLVFLGVIADKTYENTEMPYDIIINETDSISDCLCGADICTSPTSCTYTLAKTNVLASTIVVEQGNATTFTITTDYTVNSNDDDAIIITYVNSTDFQAAGGDSNNTYINYNRFQNNYVQGSGAARTILGLNSLWFSVGIFIFVAGVILAYLKKNDWF